MTRWRSEVQVLYGAWQSHVKNYGKPVRRKASNVDEYITHARAEAQAKLRELRDCIRSILPRAEEKIWYGVPFYHEGGEVVGFSLAKHHVSVGVGAEVLPGVRRQKLEKSGYRTGQCTVQVRFDQAIPVAVLRQMLREKVKLNRLRK